MKLLVFDKTAYKIFIAYSAGHFSCAMCIWLAISLKIIFALDTTSPDDGTVLCQEE